MPDLQGLDSDIGRGTLDLLVGGCNNDEALHRVRERIKGGNIAFRASW